MRYDLFQGDLQPPIGTTLGGLKGGLPVGATVTFTMSQADGTKRVTGPAVVDDPLKPIVHYQWLVGDTDVPGVYRAVWQVLFAAGVPETFPSDEVFYVVIHPKL